jgi:drug/metabolite transporter (DMT)-like permease
MLAFLSLCLLARFAYSFNDILVGAVAREYDRVEVASLRGLSLGLTMSPLLLWVPFEAFLALAVRWPTYLLLIALTGLCNVLQNHAARFLPFGLRAAITLSAVSLTAVLTGAAFLGERLSFWQGVFCLVLVGSAVVAAFGIRTPPTRSSRASRRAVPSPSAPVSAWASRRF